MRNIPLLVAMAERDMTQAELSEKTGLNLTTINGVINGRLNIHLHSAQLIARTLGVSIDALFAHEPQPQESDQ